MNSPTFTEDDIERLALQWFESLGYPLAYGPDIAPGEPAAERERYEEPFLPDRLRDALFRLNPGLPRHAIEEAYRRITRPASPAMEENNHAFHAALSNGIDVEYAPNGITQTVPGVAETAASTAYPNSTGMIRHGVARCIDFEYPENNDWLVVNQFTIVENQKNRRPDIVVFVNGLPLAIFELKSPSSEKATIWSAFTQLQNYKDQISTLFNYNEILIISDGIGARIGSISSGKDRFMHWRTIDGTDTVEPGQTQLEVLIKGVFEKERFLAYLHDFILFEEHSTHGRIKKIAAYHQFHAVREALISTTEAISLTGNRRCGVVWHTQGSGKSLTMVFYARALALHPELKNPTIVVITDENDLDDQLFATFSRCHEHLRQTPDHATSRRHLRELLGTRESGGIIFTTIQKFFPEGGEEVYPTLSERRNIIVIADEAHRSQYGLAARLEQTSGKLRYGFAKFVRDGLPNASFIGFTGTPIALKDRDTKEVFGDYISIYDVQQAVLDEATVPIYYESRHVPIELKATPAEIDPAFDTITEDEEEYVSERLKGKWAALEALVGEKKRVTTVAEDILNHFEARLEVFEGKALVVCMSRRICVEMYQALTALRPDWHSDDDRTGAIKVVMSGSRSEKPEWQAHIRNKQERETIRNRFVDENDPLKIVIVRDMWLTGFDAPCLHTMYIDKPMQGHGLMQAIARVNRVFKDKPGGLVVDYIGIAPQLKEAMNEYTDAGKKKRGLSVDDKEQAVELMVEKYEVCKAMLHGFDWSAWATGEPAVRLALIPGGMEHILQLQDGKKRFADETDRLSKAYALSVPHPETERIRSDVAYFQAIRAQLIKSSAETRRPSEDLDHAIKQLVSHAVAPNGVIDIFEAVGLPKPDISIFSDEFLAEVRALPQKNVAVELLRRLLNDEVSGRARKNVVQYRRFSEMLEATLRKYENRSVETAMVIEELIKLSKEIQESDKRSKELNISEAELAFYDAIADSESASAVMEDEELREIAAELVHAIQKNVTIDWKLRESVRAKMKIVVKRILRKHGYPPDKQERATETVLEQAEILCEEVVAA